MNKGNRIMVILLILGTLLFGGYFLFFNSSESEMMIESETIRNNQASSDMKSEIMKEDGDVKVFEVSGDNFSFSVIEMRVKEGDKVRVVFNVEQGFHDFVLDEFNAKTKQMGVGSSETIEFIANKAGTFEYYCSVGNHRAMGMVGKLIVE